MGEHGGTILVTVLLVVLAYVVREWTQYLQAAADEVKVGLEEALARERRTMERLLDLQARTGAPMLTDAEVAMTLADGDEEEFTEPYSPPPEEVEFLQQWDDASVRRRWEQYLANRRAEGRTPFQALADAEALIVGGRERIATEAPPTGIQIDLGGRTDRQVP